jgi:ATP-dependent clp protease ATP-binding subunit (fragment)
MQRVQIGDDRQSSDDLWDETEALEVTSIYIAEKLLFFVLRELSARAVIPDDASIETMSDLTLNTIKGSCTDEEDLLGIDLNHLLIWMLTTSLRGDVHDRALEKLQKPLLDSFATDITSDGGIVTLTSDLIDLIDEDDPTLCGCDIIVCDLKETSE